MTTPGSGLLAISGRTPPAIRPIPQATSSARALSNLDVIANAEVLKPPRTLYTVMRERDQKHADDFERFRRPPQTTEQRESFQKFSLQEMSDAVGTTPYLEERRRLQQSTRDRLVRKAAKAAAKHGVAAPLVRALAASDFSSGTGRPPSAPQRPSSACDVQLRRARSTGGLSRPSSASNASARRMREEAGPHCWRRTHALCGEEPDNQVRKFHCSPWQSGLTSCSPSDISEHYLAEDTDEHLAETQPQWNNRFSQANPWTSSLNPRGSLSGEESMRSFRRSPSVSESSVIPLDGAVALPGHAESIPSSAASVPDSVQGQRRHSDEIPKASYALHVLSSTLEASTNTQVAEALKVLEEAIGPGRRPASAASTRSLSTSGRRSRPVSASVQSSQSSQRSTQS